MPIRRIYLLRHAKSSWEQRSLPDRERPLAKRGRKACKLIRAHLPEAGVRPGAVLVSPAVRASQTFERIRAGLPKKVAVWTEERIYTGDREELLGVLRELPAELDSVMLIGHNPSIQGLATMLASEGAELARVRRKYPTAALATLTFKGTWPALGPGVAELEAFVRPKQL